ncbi:MAG TPA: hypothetical protein VGM50_04325 [Gemmatimonadaceae bacterium]
MRAHLLGLALAAALPAVAIAQAHTTGSPGRVAGIAPAAPQAPAAGNYRFNNVPMTVSADGRVFANFGRGYEQLVRNCAVPLSSFSQPPTTQPVVVQPSPYTPPVPNPQTPSQAAAARASGAASSQPTNSRECWSTDARGQPLIGR